MEPFLGQILIVGFNFAPRGWAFCNGQLLSVAQNTALFSLLGTFYGGNGQTTFGLPDLRGRTPIGFGQGPGLPNVSLGEMSGSPTHTLISTEMPTHNHTLNGVTEPGDVASPAGAYLAGTGGLDPEYRASGTIVGMGIQSVGLAGGSQPFSIMQPYIGMNYIIALSGIYPSRN